MATASGPEALKAVVAPEKKERPKDFPSMLEQWKPEIAKALPAHMNADRMARIALTSFRRNPKLSECDPLSIFASVIQASQLGLEIDTLGRAYLVPYKRRYKDSAQRWQTAMECQMIPGWKGLVDLMNRSGQGTVYTGVIFNDQDYRFRDGSHRELEVLNETEKEDAADITHAYAIGFVKGSPIPIIELWRMAKIIRHRDRFNKVGDQHYSFTNMEMYARKVPLLQVLKYMPCSTELALAMALNEAGETTGQGLNVKDAINGSWEPVPDDGGGYGGGDAGGGTETETKTGTSGDPQMTRIDAIAKLPEFKDRQTLDDWVSALPRDISGDKMFSDKYKERWNELK